MAGLLNPVPAPSFAMSHLDQIGKPSGTAESLPIGSADGRGLQGSWALALRGETTVECTPLAIEKPEGRRRREYME